MLCVVLSGFHALTGWDSTSFIDGIGKEERCKIFEQDEVYTDALSLLGKSEVVPPRLFNFMEQFVCYLYNFPEGKDINEVRYKRFISQTETKINLETVQSQSNYIALIMKSAFQAHPVTLLPQDHDWLLKDGNLKSQWVDQPFIRPSLSQTTSC